jgi:Ca2+-binding EF-hand superfamily protein
MKHTFTSAKLIRRKKSSVCKTTFSFQMGNFLPKQQVEHYITLTDDELACCRTATGFSDDEIRKEHDKFFAIAEDGRLKKTYTEELLGDYIPAAKWKRVKYLTECIFSAIDTNNDGHIDFLEYLMSIKFFQTESPAEKANFIFRIIDKNGDNLVSTKEIARVLECLEEYHKTSSNTQVTNVMSNGARLAANAIIEKLDREKTGSIGSSEFIDGWLRDETIRALFTF